MTQQTYSLQQDHVRQPQVFGDLGDQLHGQRAQDVAVERPAVQPVSQVAPFVGVQQGHQAVEADKVSGRRRGGGERYTQLDGSAWSGAGRSCGGGLRGLDLGP